MVTASAQEPPVIAAQKPRRRPLSPDYRRVDQIIDFSEAEKAAMGSGWVLIGYDCAEQLTVIARQHYVVVTKRAKYAPVNETIQGAEQGIRTAPRPDQIIPKSIAHSSVIADALAKVITHASVICMLLSGQAKLGSML